MRRRPNQTFIIIVCASIIMLILLFCMLSSNSRQQIRMRDSVYAHTIGKEIEQLYLGAVIDSMGILTGRKEISDTLSGKGEAEDVLSLLTFVSEFYDDSVVYLMDKNGMVLAGTPFNDKGETFAGENYGFRPYFALARKKEIVIYPAVGVTSGIRGLYFSKAVWDQDSLLGVLVIKLGIEDLENQLKEYQNLNISLITPESVVFASGQQETLYHYLLEMPEEALDNLEKSKQFFQMPLSRLGTIDSKGHLIIGDDKYDFGIVRMAHDGWRLLYYRPVESYVIQRSHLIIFLITAGLTFLMFGLTAYLLSNIEQKRQAEEKLQIYRFVVQQSPVSILITDMKGTIEYVNDFFCSATGYDRMDLIGRNPSVLKSGRHDKDFYRRLWRKVLSGETWQGEIYNRKKDGSFYWEDAQIYPLIDDSGRTVKLIGIKEDITDKKEFIQQLEYYASIDGMTSVYNRRTGLILLERQMSQAAREKGDISICYGDINNLKRVNDTLGHGAGDTLIILGAKIMSSQIREADTICRLGGDEFLIILPNTNRKDAGEAADRIRQELIRYNREDNRESFEISISLGVAQYDKDRHKNMDVFIHEAEVLMYNEKRELKKKMKEK